MHTISFMSDMFCKFAFFFNMEKFKPDVDYEAENILIGISCHLKDYRLVHYINKTDKINLSRYDDLVYVIYPDKNDSKKKIEINYPFYYYYSEDDYLAFNFIGNRIDDSVLLAEYDKLDFIIIINGAIENYDHKQLIKYLKQIPNVLVVAELKFDLIKNIKPILEDLEMHVFEKIKKPEIEKNRTVKAIAKNKLKL